MRKGAADRFSTIAVKEDDITNGQMEELVIDGVSEILEKLKRKPTVVILFTVCIHHFMGCDIAYIYRTLRERYPQQHFIEAYMDPIMQKGGITPDQKLRKAMYDCLEKREQRPEQINIIGNDLPLQPDCEMLSVLREHGCTVKDLTACDTSVHGGKQRKYCDLSAGKNGRGGVVGAAGDAVPLLASDFFV